MPPKAKATTSVVKAYKPQALDLGVLQAEQQSAAKALKAANTAASKANEAQQNAEHEYETAKKALAAGVAQITAATKV